MSPVGVWGWDLGLCLTPSCLSSVCANGGGRDLGGPPRVSQVRIEAGEWGKGG